TELRRALREADARLYMQKIASEAVMVPPPRRSRGRRLLCVAASLGAGMLVIGAELLHQSRVDELPPIAPTPGIAVPLTATPAAAAVVARRVHESGSLTDTSAGKGRADIGQRSGIRPGWPRGSR